MSDKITAFIFTKNRACQCHLLLESLEKNLPGVFLPYALWKADTSEFRNGYSVLEGYFPGVKWVEEKHGPRGDLLDACEYASDNSKSGLIAIFTDDCVVWKAARITAESICGVMRLKNVLCLSLRLGKNTTVQNYLTGEVQPPLEDEEKVEPYRLTTNVADLDKWLMWSYSRFDFRMNYGYPFGMDGHLFRSSDVWKWTAAMEGMKTYRDWEGALHLPQNRDRAMRERSWMVSPEVSCVINIPANSVQVDPTLSGQRHSYSVEELNQRYLGGEKISLDGFDWGEVKSCHAEFPYAFMERT